ncbi:MAG: hypothetical protein ABW178_08505 [Pseudoxanthomonas sp.]
MATTVFIKTAAGRQEIEQRTRKLAAGVRSILLMIDGQRTLDELDAMIEALHAPPDTMAQLLVAGLAKPVEAGAVAVSEAEEASHAAAATLSPAAQRYIFLYTLLSDSIRAHLGLKGYFLQLKVERATDADALLLLLPDIRDALAKVKKVQFADRWLASARDLAAT